LHTEGCVFELTPSGLLSECNLQLSKWLSTSKFPLELAYEMRSCYSL